MYTSFLISPACRGQTILVEPILAEFRRVDDRALRRPPTQMRWVREMTTKFLRREFPGDAPGRPPPSRLWTLQTYVDYQHSHCMHPHWPRRFRSRALHRNCDLWHVVVCMSIPNTRIGCSSRLKRPGHQFPSICEISYPDREGLSEEPQDRLNGMEYKYTQSHTYYIQFSTVNNV